MTPGSPPPRYNVLGAGVSAVTLKGARDLIVATRGTLHRGYVCLATVNGIYEARADPAYRALWNRSFLTTPDGMPLVWLGPRGTERVYGPDLMLEVCDAGRACGLRHYLFGGGAGVAELLRERLTARLPGLQVVGTYTPPFRELDPGELGALRAEIAAVRPDIIWVGLGTPKQERFMAAQAESLEAALLIGVGAAFDFLSGRVRQAPRWIQRSGFEWLFRLCTEPRRLAPRYFKTNPAFLIRVLAQAMGLRRYPIE